MEERPTMERLGDSVLVPGFIAGMHEAVEFAKFPLSSLLEPALYFAEKGFKMPHELSRMIQRHYEGTLLRTDEGTSRLQKPVKHTLAYYTLLDLLHFIVHKFFVFSFVFLVYYTLLQLSYYTLFHGFLH